MENPRFEEKAMRWNDAAEDLVKNIAGCAPRAEREAVIERLTQAAERRAEEEGLNRVGVEVVIAAWVETTPAALRSDLARRMESLGLDSAAYAHLLGGDS
ncbi:MAG TPA: hypothetical protein DEH78_23755 [Solibacterales bacterium]|nr:hypothetical protein [Bryobacterales bacterium]